jgi:hypothetical protein
MTVEIDPNRDLIAQARRYAAAKTVARLEEEREQCQHPFWKPGMGTIRTKTRTTRTGIGQNWFAYVPVSATTFRILQLGPAFEKYASPLPWSVLANWRRQTLIESNGIVSVASHELEACRTFRADGRGAWSQRTLAIWGVK